MKKIVLFLFVVCAALTVNAQVYVGGGLSFWHNDDADTEATSFAIAPEIGYNFNDKWAVGAELGFGFVKDGPKTFSIAPYARYSYFETGIVRLFIDGGFGVGYVKPDKGDSTTGFEIGLKPGIAIKLTDKFSLISKIGFLGYRDKLNGNGFGLNASGQDMSFGFQVNF